MIKEKYKQLGEANKLNTVGSCNFVRVMAMIGGRNLISNSSFTTKLVGLRRKTRENHHTQLKAAGYS